MVSWPLGRLNHRMCRLCAAAGLVQKTTGFLDVSGGVLLQHSSDEESRVDRAIELASHRVLVLPAKDQADGHRMLHERLTARAVIDSWVSRWMDKGGVDLMRQLTQISVRQMDSADAVVLTGADLSEPESVQQLLGSISESLIASLQRRRAG